MNNGIFYQFQIILILSKREKLLSLQFSDVLLNFEFICKVPETLHILAILNF